MFKLKKILGYKIWLNKNNQKRKLKKKVQQIIKAEKMWKSKEKKKIQMS